MSTTDEHPAPRADQHDVQGPSAEARAVPLLGVHALPRDPAGLLLVVDRGTEGGRDLPSNLTDSELPAIALTRHLRGAAGVEAGAGRLLAGDGVSRDRGGMA
ncbi:hypothetical protein [Kitasatospora cheerisanensis]|uniref:Uncharacterized protein n=1 Tax=Kitasatospora cheerisanensis KCTC 2395 TaxID=1348663 RepID=A0A066YIR3_9ACTN|nr:hypothetical protein [Kitasatospora cheerisanensis]KDN81047.1 hypothetical protein KCH_71410 [Kitasatospora cheerisanensis KCTC 2395]